jgi:hypothetical protein
MMFKRWLTSTRIAYAPPVDAGGDEDDLHDEEIENLEDGEHEEGNEADDAAEQDEGQTDGEEAAEEVEAQSERKPSRGESRFQKLANEAREAREENARLKREFDEFKAEQSRRAATVEKKEPTAEEMALWSTEQVIDYKLQKATGQFTQTLQQLQWNTQEANDKAAFERLKLSDPRAKKYADEVETRLAAIRKQGQNVDRESLLKFVIGEKVYQGGGKAAAKQKKQGEEQIRRQRTSPPAGRSDVRGGRTQESEAEARRKRLENVVF